MSFRTTYITDTTEAREVAAKIEKEADRLHDFLGLVDALVDAAGDVAGNAETLEHPEHGAGYWISGKEYEALRKAYVDIE
jgi:hypothetical protein